MKDNQEPKCIRCGGKATHLVDFHIKPADYPSSWYSAPQPICLDCSKPYIDKHKPLTLRLYPGGEVTERLTPIQQ